MKKLFLTLFILSPLLILVACSPQTKYDIIVSDYFTYDIVRNITGDTVEIKMLQPIHMDYHSYEPSSRDLVDLKNAKVFIYISINQSPWLGSDDNVDRLLNDGEHISFETLLDLELDHDHDHDDEHDHDHDDEHDHDHDDEHDHDHDHEHDDEHDHDHGFDFISNPFYVATIIQNLGHYLSEVFPEYEDTFDSNADDYYDRLMELIMPYYEATKDKEPRRIYFIGHNALAGFSEAFNLEIYALDESISPNSDITSTQVTNFIRAIQDNNVNTIFVEESPDIQTINYIKSQVGNIIIHELHTFHKISTADYNNNIGYLELIERNLINLSIVSAL